MVEVRKMKFGNRMYIIFDEFEYYGVKYLMLVEDVSDKLAHDNIFNKNEGTNMIIDFVYKTDDDCFENVVNTSLYHELMAYADIRREANQNEIFNFYLDSLIANSENTN